MSPEEIGSNLETFDYEYYLNTALEQVPEGIDTREGSIIYDALAPACYLLADFTMQLKNVMLDTFVQTAVGEYLDFRAEEVGVERLAASKAIAKARFTGENEKPFSLAVGSRFSTIGDEPVYFSVISEDDEPGVYRLLAEEAGSIGNEYIGEILPIDNFNGLVSAQLFEIVIPARDIEEDDSLRERVIEARNVVSFGGNIQDYVSLTSSIDGVAAVQVYPVWDGGGTVRLVILDHSYTGASEELIDQVQQAIDPTKTGQGIGYAPIGHVVTVAGPTNKVIDVAFELTLNAGINLEQVREQIELTIKNYFDSVRKKWDELSLSDGYDCWIFRSQITAAILSVVGVANVQAITLNGQNADIQMTLSNELQELPILGEVVIR